MNIKILDSWLREYLETDAKPQELAKALSLTSVSVERIEKHGNDFLYDIEVTTNRPDLMSVTGIAREAAAVLPQFGHKAKYTSPKLDKPKGAKEDVVRIINDPSLVNRVLAVVMDVKVAPTPQNLKEHLEASDIRSLNNIIDVTNYTMRVIGHPTHVFDFDRLNTKILTIRESRKGESVKTLDGKEYTLTGGDIVAVDDHGRIVDLLGVMGLENSVVTDQTKRIMFFVNNNNPERIRKTSMGQAIRTDAAQINEKDIDPETAMDAMLFGIKLFEKIANGKTVSEIIDIYPKKQSAKTVTVSPERIEKIIGVRIGTDKIISILEKLDFKVTKKGGELSVTPPNIRQKEINIEEDIIEEVARVYGYHNLPSILPEFFTGSANVSDEFFWEDRVKDALKYWGYTEVYTYSMVAGNQFEGPLSDAVKIRNPLTEDHVYMRKTLVPSLLEVIAENKNTDSIKIFEITNIYLKQKDKLPREKKMFAGVLKKPNASFFEIKGLLETLFQDLGIKNVAFKNLKSGGIGADVYFKNDFAGEIEVLDENLVNFELDFEVILKHATLKKTFKPLAKFPPIIEDITLVVDENIQTGDIVDAIKSVSDIIKKIELFDKYQNSRSFRITYQDKTKNLTTEEVGEIRKKIFSKLQKKFKAEVK